TGVTSASAAPARVCVAEAARSGTLCRFKKKETHRCVPYFGFSALSHLSSHSRSSQGLPHQPHPRVVPRHKAEPMAEKDRPTSYSPTRSGLLRPIRPCKASWKATLRDASAV